MTEMEWNALERGWNKRNPLYLNGSGGFIGKGSSAGFAVDAGGCGWKGVLEWGRVSVYVVGWVGNGAVYSIGRKFLSFWPCVRGREMRGGLWPYCWSL